MGSVKGSLSAKYYNKDHSYGPRFQYPSKPTTSTPSVATESIVNDIITTTAEATTKIIDVATNVFTNSNNTQILPNATRTEGMNNTLIDEIVASNRTSAMDNTTSVINDMFNATADSEVMQDNVSTMLNAVENSTWASDINTTTEYIADIVTSTVSDIVTPTIKKEEHDMYHSYNTSYIIMGVLIAILVLIGIGLIGIYVTYKKKNSAHISGHYHSHGSREIPSGSMKDLEIATLEHHSKC